MSICSNSQPIALVCAADNNYAMPLAVTVRSALTNIKSNRKIALFIIDGGISQANKLKIIKSLNSEKIDISWLQPDNTLFEDLVISRHLTVTTYYRFSIPELLPQNFDKAIYLDSDMVVTGDLEELWTIDVGDNYVLAVQDDHQLYISNSDALKAYEKLGIPLDYKYFNAGLLVINLERWRSENIGKKLIESMKIEHLSNDQDALNAVFAGKWQELHPKWNQMPRIYEYSSWQDSPFPEPVYNELLHQPQIIHFTCHPKPWYAGLQSECTHPKKDLFFRYLDLTAWSGWRDTLWRRLARKFMKLTSLNTSKL
jgi:lipopolysaccharide biosynthesis glycosyltransferase